MGILMTEVHTTQVSGNASQPTRFVVFRGETLDEAQASGQWIAAVSATEVSR